MAVGDRAFCFTKVVVVSFLCLIAVSEATKSFADKKELERWFTSIAAFIFSWYHDNGITSPGSYNVVIPEIMDSLFNIISEYEPSFDCILVEYSNNEMEIRSGFVLGKKNTSFVGSKLLIYVEYETKWIPAQVNDEQYKKFIQWNLLKNKREKHHFLSIRGKEKGNDTEVSTNMDNISKYIAMIILHTITLGATSKNTEIITTGLGGNLVSMAIDFLGRKVIPDLPRIPRIFTAINPVLKEHAHLPVYKYNIEFYFASTIGIEINRENAVNKVNFLFTKTLYSRVIVLKDLDMMKTTSAYAQVCDELGTMECMLALEIYRVKVTDCREQNSSKTAGNTLLTKGGCYLFRFYDSITTSKVVLEVNRRYGTEGSTSSSQI